MLWACDEQGGALLRNEGDGNQVQGRRKTGKTKRRWLGTVKDDIKEKGLSVDDAYDRATWRCMSSYIDPT